MPKASVTSHDRPATRPRRSAAIRPRRSAAIRPATASDLDAIERIEREQFSNPWAREYYAAELLNDRCHFFVVMPPSGGGAQRVPGAGPVDAAAGPNEALSGPVAGFLLFWRLGCELELHKIAVAEAFQRRGLAAHLMEFFINAGRNWGCERVVLEVRAANAAAIRLYERFGFRAVGRRKGYYTNPSEDALVFALRL